MNHDELADSIIDLVWRILRRGDAPVAKVYTAHFSAINAGDPNLGDITLTSGSLVKGCPHLNSDTFSIGDPILVMSGPGVSYTIIGKIVGDITLAI